MKGIFISSILLIAGCGVKGRPQVPDQLPMIGRGQLEQIQTIENQKEKESQINGAMSYQIEQTPSPKVNLPFKNKIKK